MPKNLKQMKPEKAYKMLLDLPSTQRDDGYSVWFFDEKGFLSLRYGIFISNIKKFYNFRKPNYYVPRNRETK